MKFLGQDDAFVPKVTFPKHQEPAGACLKHDLYLECEALSTGVGGHSLGDPPTHFSGLSPDLQSMEQIRRIMRPTDVPDQGLLCDLLWSDPDKDVLGWGENDRGVSFTFGAEVVAKFLHKHDLDLICRAHQVRGAGRRPGLASPPKEPLSRHRSFLEP